MIIDGFSHILPKFFTQKLIENYPTNELRGLTKLYYFSDIETRVRILDKYKIDKQILTLARPNIWIGMPKDVALTMTKIANEEVAEAAMKFPDRFIPVGTLPRLDKEFISEFDRCIRDLGMAGIQIFSNIDGRYLDSPEFKWFFSKANEIGIPIWIHPQVRVEWSVEFALDKILGWPFDTSVVMSRLVFSGIMEEFSNLKIITHHMGGMIPFYSERIKGSYLSKEMFTNAGFISLPREPLEYLHKFYADTVLNGSVSAFECGYKFFGSNNIIFATDYPFGPEKGEYWIRMAFDQMEKIKISKKEKDKILGGNLEKLIKKK